MSIEQNSQSKSTLNHGILAVYDCYHFSIYLFHYFESSILFLNKIVKKLI